MFTFFTAELLLSRSNTPKDMIVDIKTWLETSPSILNIHQFKLLKELLKVHINNPYKGVIV